MAVAAIVEGDVLDGDMLLHFDGQRRTQVRAFLHRSQNRLLNLIPHHIADISKTQHLAQRSVRLDRAQLRLQLQLGVIRPHRRSELQLQRGVAADQTLHFIIAEKFHTGPAFVVQMHHGEGGVRGGGGRGAGAAVRLSSISFRSWSLRAMLIAPDATMFISCPLMCSGIFNGGILKESLGSLARSTGAASASREMSVAATIVDSCGWIGSRNTGRWRGGGVFLFV